MLDDDSLKTSEGEDLDIEFMLLKENANRLSPGAPQKQLSVERIKKPSKRKSPPPIQIRQKNDSPSPKGSSRRLVFKNNTNNNNTKFDFQRAVSSVKMSPKKQHQWIPTKEIAIQCKLEIVAATSYLAEEHPPPRFFSERRDSKATTPIDLLLLHQKVAQP